MSSNTKIMIVDDSPLDRKMIAKVISRRGWQCLEVGVGEECEAAVASQKPDLILLDLILGPSTDGNQILHSLRGQYNSIELPIIMITGKSDPSDIVLSLSLGANDYIVKPIHREVTLMRIETQLKIAQLSKEMAALRELQTVGAMIVTYNHEINNPLATAIASLPDDPAAFDKSSRDRMESALWSISDIVKKIEAVKLPGTVEYEPYIDSSDVKKIKLR
jgi:DNA-binding response OmpR family regulator